MAVAEWATEEIPAWCTSVIGPYEIVSGVQRPDGRSLTSRLKTASGHYWLKVHEQSDLWEREVHGYELWTAAFGGHAPRLLALHEERPLALIIDELAGSVLEDMELTVEQERAIWHTAGQRLTHLHGYAEGEFFGPCRRDGSPLGKAFTDSVDYVGRNLEWKIEKALAADLLDKNELSVLRAAQKHVPAFAGERPIPCHRDYCPHNWMVDEQSDWVGVIDFEFAHWDVRIADFTRYPNWEWIDRPDLLEAFFEGYGRHLTQTEEMQRLVGHAQYALSAITWGMEASYFGFVDEGRQALRHLAPQLR